MPEALRMYAANGASGAQAPREIGEALRAGGIKSRSPHYTSIIRTTLRRLGTELGWKKLEDGRWEPMPPQSSP